MLKFGVLTILLFGLSCGADLKVHLLNEDGIQNSSLPFAEGLVLAILGPIVAGFEYKKSGHKYNDARAQELCEMMGFDGFTAIGDADYYNFNRTELDQIPYVIQMTNASYNGGFRLGKQTNSTQFLYLQCYKAQPSPWEFLHVYLLHYNESTGNGDIGNEGVLMLVLENEQTGDQIWGSVCSGEYLNYRIADIVCQRLGYDKADMYGNHSDFRYIPRKKMEEIQTVLYDVKCAKYAKSIDDCSYKVGYDSYCSHEEDVVLRCQGGDDSPATEPIKTIFTTLPPFSTPMNNEVKVDFGGADVQVKVGPQKIRAKLSDIWEEIFGY